MLKGTSHKPDEVITYQADRPARLRAEGNKGDAVRFQPRLWTATVEKVAVNAVMAGCKPEHLPVVLAIAESGLTTGTTNFPTQVVVLSGPIVKEIGLNTGCGHLGPGSRVNGPIGRAFQLMALNLGGAIPGVNRMSAHGSPMNKGGMCVGENVDGLPPGWKGLNEEHGFKKDESVFVFMTIGNHGGILGHEFSPGGYRALQKSGHGGMARRLGVKGTPGPHNWLEYLFPRIFSVLEGGFTLIMVPEMARHLYEIGFKSKDDVYEWIYKKSFETARRIPDAFMARSHHQRLDGARKDIRQAVERAPGRLSWCPSSMIPSTAVSSWPAARRRAASSSAAAAADSATRLRRLTASTPGASEKSDGRVMYNGRSQNTRLGQLRQTEPCVSGP